MTVRSFDGIDDRIVCSPGSVITQAVAANRTWAAIVKSGANGQSASFICLNASSDHGAAFALTGVTDRLTLRIDGGSTTIESTITFTTALGWCLIAVNKASGTTTPRFHLYRFDTQAWTHTDGGGTVGDGTLGATVDIELAALSGGFDTFQGSIAVAAIFPSSMSDAAIEALAPGLQEWVDGSPSGLWPLTQAAVTTPVDDITGNGANETSRTGTAVVTGDDPPGFDFTLGGPPDLEEGPQQTIHRSNLRLG